MADEYDDGIDYEIEAMADEMLDELDDDVVNSSLYAEEGDLTDFADEQTRNTFGLKTGVIIKKFECSDEKNVSKITPEYEVEIFEQSGDDPTTTNRYRNCVTLDAFGGIADFIDVKYRVNVNEEIEGKLEDEVGASVLVLCVDGNGFDGVIIGGAKHPGRVSKLTTEAGHHLEGEFNGLNWKIQNDGSLTVTFRSPTDAKGIPFEDGGSDDPDAEGTEASEKVGGTTVSISADGSVEANTGLEEDDETYIRMDKKNKDIGLKAGQHIGLTAKKNIGLNADVDLNLKAKDGNIAAMAGGTANIESVGAFDLKSDASMSIKAAELQIDGGAGIIAKGQQVTIDSPLIQVGNGGTPALVLSTQFLGIGNLGAPVVSQAIGPFSSSVFIGA